MKNCEIIKHKALVGPARELVAGGETLETALGVSRELFFVGNETHEASVGATRELVFGNKDRNRKRKSTVYSLTLAIAASSWSKMSLNSVTEPSREMR